MLRNGLKSFAMQAAGTPSVATNLAASVDKTMSVPGLSRAALDPESVAKSFVETAFASQEMPSFNAVEASGVRQELKPLGTEAMPLTGTTIVKFRQHFNKIPVYGSLVTVELDQNNNLVTLNSSLGEPSNVDPLARMSSADVMAKVRELAGQDASPANIPRLVYYFNLPKQRWHLAYLIEDVHKSPHGPQRPTPNADVGPQKAAGHVHGMPEIVDYVIDAHSGEVLAELPRVHNAQVPIVAVDEAGESRTITCEQGASRTTMFNQDLNVRTFDFTFRDIDLNRTALPGADVARPPEPFSPAAVSAHANAEVVAGFVRDVLLCNGLDNQGERYVSSVNCVSVFNGSVGQEWRNAAWIGTQMVYGQRRTSGQLRSYSVALDVVAHEILHGITDRTSRLQYQRQTGALNESYSDIFGVIISNWPEPNFNNWSWELGEGLSGTGVPLRDLSNPGRFGQPTHMDQYEELPLNDDNGGVHLYSGIHNLAFHNLAMTRAAGGGAFLFAPGDLAAMFYIALSQHLSRTSQFSDSRRGVEMAAASLLRNDAANAAKLAAIADRLR